MSVDVDYIKNGRGSGGLGNADNACDVEEDLDSETERKTERGRRRRTRVSG
jgi:hypothetical protein